VVVATRHLVSVEAPSHLGLRAEGVARLPATLLAEGLADRLGAVRGPRVPAPRFEAEIDPGTHMLNPTGLRDYSVALADVVGSVLDAGAIPLVLGGDCSILLGNMLALKRRGRYGLLFIDGHSDFYQPSAEPSGEAASMDLALVTGRGPEIVTNLEGRRPLVLDEDVVVFGARDAKEAAADGSQPLALTLKAIDLPSIRKQGTERAVRSALEHLERSGAPGFWIHLDVDVLDDAIMPAVDYHLPDGFSWKELIAVLGAATASDRFTGLEVTIFNPTLDPDGRIAIALVDALVAGMSR
jgi:arginase